MAKKKADACPVPAGVLLLIGGHENKGEDTPDNKSAAANYAPLQVLEGFKGLLKRDPLVEVITTSTEEPEEYYAEYKKVFDRLGIKKIGHIHHTKRQDVLDDPLEERLKAADAVYFTGGNQLLLTAIYGGTQFLTLLKKRYINEKIVVAGTSAGAMALSTPMIYAGNEEVQELGGEIKITTGLEFLKDACVDTHFVHRGRFVRMAQVIVTNPTCVGFGIEEDTALIVRNGTEMETIGSGTVIILEGFDISEFNVSEFLNKTPVSLRDLRVHLLVNGDKYQLKQMNPPHV